MTHNDHIFSGCIYFTSNAFARRMERLAAQCWKPASLSPSLAYLLMAVLHEPGIQPGKLAEGMRLEASTVTRLLQSLEKAKLAVRTGEGRIVNVYPTPAAKKLKPLLAKCAEDFGKRSSALLGSEQTRVLNQHLWQAASQQTD